MILNFRLPWRSKHRNRRNRVVEKKGNCNIEYKQISKRRRRFITDAYTTLIDSRLISYDSLFNISLSQWYEIKRHILNILYCFDYFFVPLVGWTRFWSSLRVFILLGSFTQRSITLFAGIMAISKKRIWKIWTVITQHGYHAFF